MTIGEMADAEDDAGSDLFAIVDCVVCTTVSTIATFASLLTQNGEVGSSGTTQGSISRFVRTEFKAITLLAAASLSAASFARRMVSATMKSTLDRELDTSGPS